MKASLRNRVTEFLSLGRSFVYLRLPDGKELFLPDDSEEYEVSIHPWKDDGSRVAEPVWRRSTPEAEYKERVGALVERLKLSGGKAVVSRAICGNAGKDARWADVASRFIDSHPGSLGFIFDTPATGAWIGASPELLLGHDASDGSYVSMALAGTRPRTLSDIPPAWDAKNVHEHRYVTDFIRSVFESCGLKCALGPQETVRYGNIEHICTHIEGAATGVCHVDFGALASRLHPTPALCGFPREEALAEIEAVEAHPRGCYGGYIRIRRRNDGAEAAFVLLRCCNFDREGNWCVYAGGGITPYSDVDSEWDEAWRKAALVAEIEKA